MAKRLRIEGSLVVRFTIRSDGSIDESSIQIIDSSNYNVLDKGAVQLIKKYVPEFAKKYGKKPPKGDLTIELPITFEIIGW
jgi:protein TonB